MNASFLTVVVSWLAAVVLILFSLFFQTCSSSNSRSFSNLPCIFSVFVEVVLKVAEAVYLPASWELWKHSDPVPGGRSMVFKAKLPKESKNGFKTISCHSYPEMFFFKKTFSTPKITKKIGCFINFWIFMSIPVLEGTFFTFGHSRMFGHDKLLPLAIGCSRSHRMKKLKAYVIKVFISNHSN